MNIEDFILDYFKENRDDDDLPFIGYSIYDIIIKNKNEVKQLFEHNKNV